MGWRMSRTEVALFKLEARSRRKPVPVGCHPSSLRTVEVEKFARESTKERLKTVFFHMVDSFFHTEG